MASPRIIKSTPQVHGSLEGVAFDDSTAIKDLQKATIHRIVLTYDTYIRSIAVDYADGPGPSRGEVVTPQCEIIMTDGEFITSIDGSMNSQSISHLAFRTNKGNFWGPYGHPNPDRGFHWGDLGPNMGLLYFSGKVDNYFRCLTASFASYLPRVLPPIALKYEEHVNRAFEAPPPDVLSTFARNLMSPTITLAAGPDAKEIKASQGILCQLPFFRAALEGEFREATEKIMSMPDDDLQSVAALVEYLYTGHYTYPFHGTRETESGVPAAVVTEGSFHASVYATAHKYGCDELVDASLTSFLYVLSNLEGIEVVRLWMIAYDQELVLDIATAHDSLDTVMQGLGRLLKGVYMTDREEMDRITVDHPTLIGDLLRLVVSREY